MGQDARRRRRRRTRSGVGGRQVGGARVDERGRGGGLAGRQSRRQQRADHARQHVAGSGCGGPRLARAVEVDRPAGFGDDGDVALQQHGDTQAGRRACGWRRCGRRRAASPPAARIHRRAASARSARDGRRRGRGVRPGSSARRRRRSRAGRSPARTTVPPRRSRRCPVPGPTTHACTRPAAATLGVAMTSGHCESTCWPALPA